MYRSVYAMSTCTISVCSLRMYASCGSTASNSMHRQLAAILMRMCAVLALASSLIAYRGCPKCLNSCCGGDAARRTFTSCTAAQFVAYDPSSFCNVLE